MPALPPGDCARKLHRAPVDNGAAAGGKRHRRDKTEMVEEKNARPGREDTMAVPQRHAVLDTPIIPPFPEGYERIVSARAASGAPIAASDS